MVRPNKHISKVSKIFEAVSEKSVVLQGWGGGELYLHRREGIFEENLECLHDD